MNVYLPSMVVACVAKDNRREVSLYIGSDSTSVDLKVYGKHFFCVVNLPHQESVLEKIS